MNRQDSSRLYLYNDFSSHGVLITDRDMSYRNINILCQAFVAVCAQLTDNRA